MPVGIFNSQSPPVDLTRKSFTTLITRLGPNGQAPLFGMTSMLKDETAFQFEHGYFAKTMIFPKLVLNGAIADGTTTTFTVVDTTNILPGMVFQVDTTRENILVNTVPSATSVTVTRNFGNNVNLGIATAVTLWMIGNAYEEASLRPQSLIINPTRITNYTQIFRNTWTISGTLAASQMIAGNGYEAESANDCAMFHAVDIEKALIFGQKFLGTKNGQPIHTMDGLINLINQYAAGNVTTLTATTNYTQIIAALDPVFNQVTDPSGKQERVFFVGGVAAQMVCITLVIRKLFTVCSMTSSVFPAAPSTLLSILCSMLTVATLLGVRWLWLLTWLVFPWLICKVARL